MRITKLEALALSKALHSLGLHGCSRAHEDTTSTTLLDLSRKVDVFLLAGDDVVDDGTPKEHGKPVPRKEPESFISGEELHALGPTSADVDNALEFEHSPSSRMTEACVDLLLGGEVIAQGITDIRRAKKALAVMTRAGDGDWVSFDVKRFPKDWIAELPLNAHVGVEA